MEPNNNLKCEFCEHTYKTKTTYDRYMAGHVKKYHMHNSTTNNKIEKILSSVNIEMINPEKLILLEKLDINVINHILDNEVDILRGMKRSKKKYDSFDTLRKIRHRMTNGSIPTKYNFARFADDGRVFADGGVSMQTICRELRHTLCRDTYIDVDFVNCHPTILKQMISDIHTPSLDFYIEHRQKVLDTGISKKEVVAIIDGKSSRITNGFGIRLLTEMKEVIYPHLCEGKDFESFRDMYDDDDAYNVNGKYISHLVCKVEQKCLLAMIEYFQEHGYMPDNIGVAMHDGIMLWKETFPTDTDAQIKVLADCVSHIKKTTDYDMAIAIKPMTDGITIPEFKADEPIDETPSGLSLSMNPQVMSAQNRGLNTFRHRSCPTLGFKEEDIIWDDGDERGRLSPFPSEGDLFIYAGMSAGKTHQCIEALKQYDTIVWLSFRQSYTSNVHGRLRKEGIDMKSYLAVEFKKAITSAGTKVIIQSESLHKYDRKTPPDLLIVDECTTVMEQAHSSGTQKDKYKANFETLMWMLKYAGRRIFMDANMDKSFVDEIKTIDKSCNRQSSNKLIVLEPKINERTTYLIKSEGTMYKWLADNKDKRLFIVTSVGVIKTNALKIFFTENGINADDIAVYNSETKSSIKTHDFENCNTEWLKYQIVICSPTIGAGVDFNATGHFDHVVGLFTNNTCTVQSARQFLRRVRNPISDTYVFYKKTNHTVGPLTMEAMDNYICAKEANIINNYDAYTFKYLKSGRKKIVHTLSYLSRMRYEIRLNRSRQFFLSEFVEQETRSGCKIIYCDAETQHKSDLKVYKEAQKQVKAQRTQDIADAPVLDKVGIDAIDKKARENQDLSQEEIMSMKKNFLRNVFRVESEQLNNPEWVETYHNPDVIKKWYNIRLMLTSGDTTEESLKKIQEDARYALHENKRCEDEGINQSQDLLMQSTINKYWGQLVVDLKWENHMWANEFLKMLGFANVWNDDMNNGMGVFDTTIEVTRADLENARLVVNETLLKEQVAPIKKKKGRKKKVSPTVFDYVGRLFEKHTYGVKKVGGFKDINAMLRWINPCLDKMYGLKIGAKSRGKKGRNIFIVRSDIDKLFTTNDDDGLRPNILYTSTTEHVLDDFDDEFLPEGWRQMLKDAEERDPDGSYSVDPRGMTVEEREEQCVCC